LEHNSMSATRAPYSCLKPSPPSRRRIQWRVQGIEQKPVLYAGI